MSPGAVTQTSKNGDFDSAHERPQLQAWSGACSISADAGRLRTRGARPSEEHHGAASQMRGDARAHDAKGGISLAWPAADCAGTGTWLAESVLIRALTRLTAGGGGLTGRSRGLSNWPPGLSVSNMRSYGEESPLSATSVLRVTAALHGRAPPGGSQDISTLPLCANSAAILSGLPARGPEDAVHLCLRAGVNARTSPSTDTTGFARTDTSNQALTAELSAPTSRCLVEPSCPRESAAR